MIPTPRLKSPSQHDFAKVPAPQIQRSSFDRSFNRSTTFDAGQLIPVYVDEVLPGDTINLRAAFVARLSTLLYPIMGNLHLDTFWFYCPNRVLWSNWKRFNGERATPTQSIDLEIPILYDSEGYLFDPLSLGDYFRLPTQITMPNGVDMPGISALPFRMYNLIWNEWFRDQNTQGQAYQATDDGPDPFNNYVILNRGKRHDYFSSCLPWPQKGDNVSLPLGSTAPIVGNGDGLTLWDGTNAMAVNFNNDTGFNGFLQVRQDTSNPAGSAPAGTAPTGDKQIGFPTGNSGISSNAFADLELATAATVNDLREAIAIQQLLELDARGGTRYKEQLLHMWGVTIPDATLQRPEYLGGSSDRMGVHAVAQTAPGSTPQASLSAFGQMQAFSGFQYSAVEHGYIMCLVNVRADLSYQQGIHRMWLRSTRYDFYQPPLAHLGEQAVYNREIYYQHDAGHTIDNGVFGYQERWAEYRYAESGVSGVFRSNHSQTLDAWHLALDFTSLPELTPDAGNGFVVDEPPVDRVIALNSETFPGQQVLFDMHAQARWARCMPVYSTPGLERL